MNRIDKTVRNAAWKPTAEELAVLLRELQSFCYNNVAYYPDSLNTSSLDARVTKALGHFQEEAWLSKSKGEPVFAFGAKVAEGRTTGGSYRCALEGCTGRRLAVRWANGKITFPCTKGMSFTTNGWRIE